MAQEYGDGAGVEAEVDGVKDSAGHGDGEVELVHGWGVGRENRHHVAALDTER